MESQFTNENSNEQVNEGYTYYTAPQPEEIVVPDPEGRRYGLGRAIAATIISAVSVIIAVIAMCFSFFGISGVEPDLYETGVAMLIAGFFFTLVAAVTSIVSLVLGVKSILCFKKKQPRPIATLILGICSTATAAESLVVVFCDLLFAVIVLSILMVA